MRTITETRTVQSIVDNKAYCPFPIETISNHMGINLCAVESVTWTKRDDGQLVSLAVNFIPDETNYQPIKVYVLGEEWYAGRSEEEVEAYLRKEIGDEDIDCWLEDEDITELTEDEMLSLQFREETGETRTFRDELNRRIADGDTFPQSFATMM